MYAVIQTGGKQYRVEEGARLEVEKLDGEPGTEVTFDQVLMIADGESFKIGKPLVSGAQVTAKIVGQEKAPRVTVFKFRRTRGYKKRTGHRQQYTALQITGITA